MTTRDIGNVSDAATRRMDLRVAVVLFFAALLSYACFSQSPRNPNLRTNMFLALSLVEGQTSSIDRYFHLTYDQAVFDGHHYSEKAPGLSLSAVPAVVIGRAVIRLTGRNPAVLDANGDLTPTFGLLAWFVTLCTSGLLAAAAVVAVYVASRRLGASPAAGIFGAAGLAWATPLWGWATALLGHAGAAAFLAVGFAILCCALEDRVPRFTPALFLAASACLTWAVVIEFTAAVASISIGLYGVWRTRNLSRRERTRIGVFVAGGIVVFSLPLWIYNAMTFGSPFHFGYTYSGPQFPAMREGLFGIGAPDPSIVFALLFGRYRGLIWVSPLAIAGLIALFWLWRTHPRRADAAILTTIPTVYLLLISGYTYWDGGWSTGPRHLTAMLPFLMIALSLVGSRIPRPMQRGLAMVALVSLLLTLLCVSTSMFAPSTTPDMLSDFLIPNFGARLLSQPPATEGVFASVLPWKTGLPRIPGLLAVLAIPLLTLLLLARHISTERSPTT